ncbi:MAG: 5'-nucleotidase, lipoprotein e(P4) family [Chitinophagaceae bacterium]
MNSRFILFLAVFFSACAVPKKATPTLPAGHLVIDGKIWSSVFQQRAAEYKALCLQAYNIAMLRVDESLLQTTTKPRAIITDIDETFLDNSPYAVHQALQGKDYEPSSWYEWTAKGAADTLAGALSFFNYAASKNIEIFYVTNREEKDRQGTLVNLQKFHFPFADDQHLVVRQTESSKEDRRKKIALTHDVILLLGDNLADFSALFDKKTESERDQNVKLLAAEFGKKFIVLPNFNYGGWEDAIYQNARNWTPVQKGSLLKSGLKNY